MLEIRDYNKSFGQKEILKNINLKLEEGKVYGLLGNNGVGKTTLLKSISNHIIHYQGNIELNGEPVTENQKVVEEITYISEEMLNSENYTGYRVKKFFKLLSRLYKNWDWEYNGTLVEKFKIDTDTKYRKLSKGQKNLVNLIIGLTVKSKITIFDEPTGGLDAKTRYKFYQELMDEIERNSRTIIISTHIVDELANYFEDVILLGNKEVKVYDSVENISVKAKSFTASTEKLQILSGKNVIGKEKFGGMEKYYVYDDFTESELVAIEEKKITAENVTLQNLLVHYE